ncbi:MAG: DUF2267 domain-containing protein [Rubrobacter sp.]|nr:DUF2267 domain-containing protein [Rubrobacter sp.]
MQYQEFINRVNERIQTEETGEAERVVQSTLATLGERLGGTEAENLASQLPAELSTQLESGNYAQEPEQFSLQEFYRRIAEREGELEPEQSKERVSAVMEALTRATSGGELRDIQRQLPEEFEPLFASG